MKIADLFVEVQPDLRGFDRQLKAAMSKASVPLKVKVDGNGIANQVNGVTRKTKAAFGKAGDESGKSFGKGLNASFGAATKGFFGALAVGQILSFGKSAVDSFGAVEDAVGAAGVQFGKALPRVIDFANKATTSFGLSKQAALEAQNTFGTLGKSAGLTENDLASFSAKMAGLAGDLASFKGTSAKQAIEAIGSALRGESEPIRAYGVLLDDATLRLRAVKLGLIATVKQGLTPTNRVLAAQAEIWAQTTDAQGDYNRTSTSTANKAKELANRAANARVELGEKLAPVVTQIRQIFIDMLPALSNVAETIGDVAKKVSAAITFFQKHPEIANFAGAMAKLAVAAIAVNKAMAIQKAIFTSDLVTKILATAAAHRELAAAQEGSAGAGAAGAAAKGGIAGKLATARALAVPAVAVGFLNEGAREGGQSELVREQRKRNGTLINEANAMLEKLNRMDSEFYAHATDTQRKAIDDYRKATTVRKGKSLLSKEQVAEAVPAVNALTAALAPLVEATNAAKNASSDLQREKEAEAAATVKVVAAVIENTVSLGQARKAYLDAVDKVGAYRESLQGLIDKTTTLNSIGQDQIDTTSKLATARANAVKVDKENADGLKFSTEAGRNNIDALQDVTSAVNDKIIADYKARASAHGVEFANKALRIDMEKGRSVIVDTGTALAGTKKEAQKYADQVLLTPEQVETQFLAKTKEAEGAVGALQRIADDLERIFTSIFEADTKQATSATDRLLKKMERFDGFVAHATLIVSDQTRASTRSLFNSQVPLAARAGGGAVFGAGTATSDSIPALLSNGEYVVRASAVRRLGLGVMDRINRFAAGGVVRRMANGGQIAQSIDETVPVIGKDVGKKVKHATDTLTKKTQEAAKNVTDLAEEIATNKRDYEFEHATRSQQIAILRKRLSQEKRFTDDWKRDQDALEDLLKEGVRAAADRAANISGARNGAKEGIFGSFFGEQPLAKRLGTPGTDSRSALGDMVSKARDLVTAGGLAQRTFNALRTKAQGYTLQLESMNKRHAELSDAIDEATDSLKDANGALADAKQAYDDYAASVADSISALGVFTSLQTTIVDQTNVDSLTGQVDDLNRALDAANQTLSDAQAAFDAAYGGKTAEQVQSLSDAQAVYNATLTKYGSDSPNTIKAASLLADAQGRAAKASSDLAAAQSAVSAAQKAAASSAGLLKSAQAGRAITAADIVGNVQGQVTAARAFASNIKTLRTRGLGQAAIMQILSAGPVGGAAFAAALVGATDGDLGVLNSAQAELDAIGKDLGGAAASWFKQAAVDSASAGVATAQGFLDGLRSKRTELETEMVALGAVVAAAFAKALGIHSPSTVFEGFGVNSVKGYMKGWESESDTAAAMAAKLTANVAKAGTASPVGALAAGGQGGGNVILQGTVIRENVDAEMLLQRLAFHQRQNGRTR